MSDKFISKDNLKLAIEGAGLGTMADWNENDKSALSYIKNRPFYTDRFMKTVLVDNLSSTTAEDDWPACTFVVGNSYKVIWNDAEYDCVCFFDGEYRTLGTTDNYPFYINDNGGDSLYVYPANTDEAWTVSIIHIDKEIKQIDPVYIPDVIARTVNLKYHNVNETSHNDIREAIANNKEQMLVWHDCTVTMPSSSLWQSVTYGNGKFVAITYGTPSIAAYSEDGINWTNTIISTTYTRWHSVTYGDGKFVAIANDSNAAAYSEDGINWTETFLPRATSWQSVTYGDGKFVAIAYNSRNAAYSRDGINWSGSTLTSLQNWQSVTYGNGKFVAITYGTDIAAYSEDGLTWWSTSRLPSSRSWQSVTYGDGKFVAIAYNSRNAAYSRDGINWTETTLPVSKSWYSVTYGDGKFVAIAYNSNIAVYSRDGITWTETLLPSSQSWRSITYGNGKFVAIAYNRSDVVTYSEDGINWTSEFKGLSNNNKQVTDTVRDLILDGYVIPLPSTAQVGQLLSVKAVDENGKPTEWETVDMPTDGHINSLIDAKLGVIENGTY